MKHQRSNLPFKQNIHHLLRQPAFHLKTFVGTPNECRWNSLSDVSWRARQLNSQLAHGAPTQPGIPFW